MLTQLKLLCVLSVAGLFFVFNTTIVQASGLEVKQESETLSGNNSISLEDGTSVEVSNSPEETKVSIEGETITDKEFLKTSQVTELSLNEQTLLLTEYRLPGSANELIFEVYNISEGNEKLYESGSLNHGLVDVVDGEIIYGEPEFSGEENEASPSTVDMVVLQGNEEGFKETEEQEVSNEAFKDKIGNEKEVTTFSSQSNPSAEEINKLLTQKAEENNIPPEILKAIAWQESSWRQFEGGEPLIGFDGIGIGIMQVSPGYTGLPNENDPAFQEKLKNDIEFNIEVGIEILLNKWDMGRLPQVNDGSKEVIDNWYFAVMAYNGISDRNDPAKTNRAYQDIIFQHMKSSFGELNVESFPTEELNITYPDESRPTLMSFDEKKQYNLDYKLTRTKHNFEKEDIISTKSEAPVYDEINGEIISGISKSDVAEIKNTIQYDSDRLHHFGWYNVELPSGKSGYVRSGEIDDNRVDGSTRYETAVEVSKEGWNQADTVVLSTGVDFPDALAGTPLAHQENAPILLTKQESLPEETLNEIKRLSPDEVIILGGEAAVSSGVENELNGLGVQSTRLAGKDRFETAQKISEKIKNPSNDYVVANGFSFADALAAAPYAANSGKPILLTREITLPQATEDTLEGADETLAVGGTAVISKQLYSELPNAERISGSTRYGTASEIVKQLDFNKDNAFMVNGENFPDALTGSVLAAKNQAPLLLTKSNGLPSETKELKSSFTASELYVIGGTAAVGSNSALEFKK